MTAPLNDNYANAAPLTGAAGSVSGTTVEATSEARDNGQNIVWYRWTATDTSEFVFDTGSSPLPDDTDTVLYCYAGADYATATLVTSNDDYGSNNLSRIKFAATSGTEYRIGIGGYNGYAVDYVLSWQKVEPRTGPANPVNDFISQATLIPSPNGVILGDTFGDRPEPGTSSKGVWYKLITNFTGTLQVKVKGLYGGQCEWIDLISMQDTSAPFGDAYFNYEISRVYGNPMEFEWGVMNNSTYYIRVTMEEDDSGRFELTWDIRTPQENGDDKGNFVTVVNVHGEPEGGLVYNPTQTEMWVNVGKASGMYHDDVAIARLNASTGEVKGLIQYPNELSQPLIYDPFRQWVWLNDVPGQKMVAYDAITALPVGNLATHNSMAFIINPYNGTMWNSAGSDNTSSTDATNGTLIRYSAPGGAADKVIPLNGPKIWSMTHTAGDYMWGRTDQYTFGKNPIVYRINTVTSEVTRFDFNVPHPDVNFHFEKVQDVKYIPSLDSVIVFSELPSNIAGTSYPTWTTWTEIDPVSGDIRKQYRVPAQGIRYWNTHAYDEHRDLIWYGSSYELAMIAIDPKDGSVVQQTSFGTHNLNYPTGPAAISPERFWQAGDTIFFMGSVTQQFVVAPIINDRDVWLQKWVGEDRFTKVTVQPGTPIGSAQAHALSTALSGAKRLDLQASVYFFIVKESHPGVE